MPRLAAAVALSSLALLATACGEASTTSNPLSAAVERTKEAETARLLSVKRGSGLGLAYVHRRTGVVDYPHEFSSITKRSVIAGESMPVSREVKLGDDLYTQLGGRPWLHERADNGNTTGEADPTHLLGFVHDWATGVAVLGKRRLHGTETTAYRARIDLRAAVEHELDDLGWSQSAIEQFLGDELKGPTTLKVWVGADGLIRRVVLRSSSETETLDLSGFGVRVVAHAPSPSG